MQWEQCRSAETAVVDLLRQMQQLREQLAAEVGRGARLLKQLHEVEQENEGLREVIDIIKRAVMV